jgi:hypothetical protein
MGKKIRVNLTIDEDVVEKAKEIGLNISKVSENALIRTINAIESSYTQNRFNSNPHNQDAKPPQKQWWAGEDLNHRPPPRKGGILPCWTTGPRYPYESTPHIKR